MASGAEALLRYLEYDKFPESDTASAEIEDDALPTLVQNIAKARDEVQTQIRSLSREAAPDVDGWISQAKRLEADIERSRAAAQEIIQQAETGRKLREQEKDATAKSRLLEEELAFNDTLTGTLEQLQIIYGLLDSAQEASIQEDVILSLDKLQDATGVLKQLDGFANTRFAGILQDRAARLRASITEDITKCWNSMIGVDTEAKRVIFKKEFQKGSLLDIDTVVQALTKLKICDQTVHRLAQDFNQTILTPRLIPSKNNTVVSVETTETSIQASQHSSDLRTTTVLEDIGSILDFVDTALPSSVSRPLSSILIPLLLPQLQAYWLEPSIPASLDGINDLEEVIDAVIILTGKLADRKLTGGDELTAWVNDIPRLWLSKRKEAALAAIRTSCYKSTNQKKVVERVETQMVSQSDVLAGNSSDQQAEQNDDDWNQGWNDEEGHTDPSPAQRESEAAVHEGQDDDDIADAWGGFDDEEPPETKQEAEPELKQESHPNSQVEPSGENEDEAWGWGEEETAVEEDHQPSHTEATSAAAALKPKPKPAVNGYPRTKAEPAAHKEVTLRETYTVTSLPDALLELIEQNLSDAETLSGSEFSSSKVRPAANGLYSIPTLILAMYRATASTYYSKDIAGNMLIYNDCNRLSDQLRDLAESNSSGRLRVDADLKALGSLGKRSYGKEMESQRTILRDLLDGAQGFSNCTAPPFAAECENAVSMTVDRIREVARTWQGILSHSALLQSIGQLLSTVITKILIDIQDMADISEPESHRLRKFCDHISELKDLFTEDGRDMTGVYTPNWFKFQYLSEILESSLADIKYLWSEGELRLEFQAQEVVDLIEALFAQSEHRSRAIVEIRRSVR